MQRKITLLDGAVGTSLYAKAAAHGIEEHDPVWVFNLRYPDLVQELCRDYHDAGSTYIMANTFTANRQSVSHFSNYAVADVVTAGVQLARDALQGTGAKVGLAVGALAQLMKPFGPLEPAEAASIFREQIEPGVRAGANYILLQTFFDLSMMEVAAKIAVEYGIPVYCMMTFEKRRRTIMGNTVKQIIDTLTPLGIQGIGMNCSLGPEESLEVIEEYHKLMALPLMFKPNSGKPILDENGNTTQPYTPRQFADDIVPALSYVDYIGGCCGCDASYIRALRDKLDILGLR